MTSKDKELLKLCLNAFDDKNLELEAFNKFNRDYVKFSNGELTFRELIQGIQTPKGDLKKAMQAYYGDSNYSRTFK